MERSMFVRALIYVAVIGLFVAGIVAVLRVGSGLQPGATAAARVAPGGTVTAAAAPAAPTSGGLFARLRGNAADPLPLLLLQVVVIVVAARLLGAVFHRWGQPAVIGEMVAGILLGPSLLGWLWPAGHAFLFPAPSLGALRLLSQIGVILFMFVVGIELDVSHLRHRAQAAVWVSHTSITVPFLLGTAAALTLYRALAPAGTPFSAFALFLGIAMSITAFPVLARILEERGLAKTPLGTTAIACAAVDDVTAWCLLALVVAIAKADALGGALVTMLLTLAFVAIMLGPVRRQAERVIEPQAAGEGRQRGLVAGALAFVFLCALTTEVIGIHALFGAFLAGVAMPRHASIRGYLTQRIEAFASVFLLPLFFAFTGLRTQVGLLGDAQSWLFFLLVLAVAIAGKLGGSMLAARLTGMTWADSFALGALMNTRGLIELIVLNLGYDLGILSPRVFAMMVLMALITTFMTGPLLQVYEALRRRAGAGEPSPATA
jgi:Kef-type K+ transport system membrane component KefB